MAFGLQTLEEKFLYAKFQKIVRKIVVILEFEKQKFWILFFIEMFDNIFNNFLVGTYSKTVKVINL